MPYKTVWRNGIPMTEWVPDKPGRPRGPKPPAAPKWAAGVKPGTVAGTPGYKPGIYSEIAPWNRSEDNLYNYDPSIEEGLAKQPLPAEGWDRGEGIWGGPGAAVTPPGTVGSDPTTTTPPGPGGPPGDVSWVNLRRNAPDYSGILGKYTQDWQARLNSGLAAMKEQRLSRARGAINRLGVRNAAALLPKLQQYGLTEADLQAAQANPWSEMKAIEQQTADARGQSQADFAARGGFRSGGTARAMERIEDARARNEAMATEETLSGLAQDEFSAAEWEREQRDELDRRAADMEMQLAQTYQPYNVQAYWDPNAQGYRYGEEVYDQYGRKIR